MHFLPGTFRLWRLLALAGLLAACGGSPPAETAPAGAPGLIFQDDFSQVTSGWDSHRGADLTTDYDQGRYLIAVEQTEVDVWATPGLDLADVDVSAEARLAGGPVNNSFGLICRYARDGDRHRFYFFLVSSDGYYAMGKVVSSRRTILLPADGSFQPSEAIRLEPGAANQLRAVCAGRRLSFWVNDRLLGEFEDGDLARGDVGLIAGAFDEPGVRIHFDNVLVRQP